MGATHRSQPAAERFHHVVAHAEAAREYGLADGPGLVRAVDTIERRAEIERVRRAAFGDSLRRDQKIPTRSSYCAAARYSCAFREPALE